MVSSNAKWNKFQKKKKPSKKGSIYQSNSNIKIIRINFVFILITLLNLVYSLLVLYYE